MLVALDTETCLFSMYEKVPPLVCVSFCNEQRAPWLMHQADPKTYEYVRYYLSSPDVEIIGFNVAYDLLVFCRKWPDLVLLVFEAYEARRIHDGMIRERIINIASGELAFRRVAGEFIKQSYKLESIAQHRLGTGKMNDEWRLRYGELLDLPFAQWPKEAIDYATNDALLHWDVFHDQERTIAEGGKLPDLQILHDATAQAAWSWWLDLVTAWGIQTDIPRVERLKADLERQLQGHLAKLIAAGLVRPPNKKGRHTKDTKAAKAYMRSVCEAKGISVPMTKGTETTAPDVCLDKESCDETGDDVLKSYGEVAHINKILDADIPAMLLGQIHSRFESPMETGRTSCKGSDKKSLFRNAVNLQNRPVEGGIRECFTFRPGTLGIDCDYDGLELRTVAQVCVSRVGYSKLAEALNRGLDPHLIVASQILGRPYEDVVKHKKDHDVYLARQSGKIANFGYAGGMGPKTLKRQAKQLYEVDMTVDEAAALREAWLKAWPEFNDYFKMAADSIENDEKYVVHLFSNRFRGQCSFTETCNSPFQGLGADATKAAGFALAKACYVEGTVLYGSRIVNYVHDQFLVEAPESIAHECALEVQRIMIREANKYLPDVPATCTPTLCRRWSKSSLTLYDANGRLFPWDDCYPKGVPVLGVFLDKEGREPWVPK